MDGTIWVDANGDQREILLGARAQELVEIPPPPPEGAVDLRAIIAGVPYLAVPRRATADVQVSGDVSAVGWDVRIDGWELVVDGDVIALTGAGSREVRRGASLSVRSS